MGRPGPMGQSGTKGDKVSCSFIYVGSVYVSLDIEYSKVGSVWMCTLYVLLKTLVFAKLHAKYSGVFTRTLSNVIS